jgi:hypothetical protein
VSGAPINGVYVNGSGLFAVGSGGDVEVIGVNSDGTLSNNTLLETNISGASLGTPLIGGVIPDGALFFVTGSSAFLVTATSTTPSFTTSGTTLNSSGTGVQSTITFQ